MKQSTSLLIEFIFFAVFFVFMMGTFGYVILTGSREFPFRLVITFFFLFFIAVGIYSIILNKVGKVANPKKSPEEEYFDNENNEEVDVK